ncbi:MAG TPA: BON domain-containing protein [Flavobacterium sp.]|nr:BON domain-containing protein [Flavobacterium sp.]
MKTFKLKSLVLMLALSLVLFSCSPKDADIQKAITEKMAATPEMSGMTTTVTDGVVTISGQCKDEACKASCENIIKGVKGVKSVVNNCTIPAPVVINPDETLIMDVQTAIKNYPGVTSNVSQGVVTLTGEIKKDNLMPLMQSIQALNPKKVENKLIIK